MRAIKFLEVIYSESRSIACFCSYLSVAQTLEYMVEQKIQNGNGKELRIYGIQTGLHAGLAHCSHVIPAVKRLHCSRPFLFRCPLYQNCRRPQPAYHCHH